jgi:putative DNA methylase
MGARLMAIVAEGERGRIYMSPTPEHEAAAKMGKPEWKPELRTTQYLGVKPYVEWIGSAGLARRG